MPVLKQSQTKNSWKTICKQYAANKQAVFTSNNKNDDENDGKLDDDLDDDDELNKEIQNFDASKHSLVFYGQAFRVSKVDDSRMMDDFDASLSHPACYGYTIVPYIHKVDRIKKTPTPFNRKTCSEREFLETLVFPTLMSALENMLTEAQKKNCFERRRTAFNGCDFLTEYLYKNNPFRSENDLAERKNINFWQIPFIQEFNKINPRPPLPKSLIWTEEEACLKIQAFYRGYLVRRDPEVQELRKWQRELREENQNITERVEKFWNETADAAALSTQNGAKSGSAPSENNKSFRDSITIKSTGFK